MSSLASFAARPVSELKGVGSYLSQCLEKLGIHSIQDLLFHLPLRYEDRTRITPLAALQVGQQQRIIASIVSSQTQLLRTRRVLLCHLSDGTGQITLRFLHFHASQQRLLSQVGMKLDCFAEVRRGKNGLEMIHPEFQIVDNHVVVSADEALTPIYPSTLGLSQKALRRLTFQALDLLQRQPESLPEYLPQDLLSKLQFTDLHAALSAIHRPSQESQGSLLESGRHPAQQRLIFEEMLAQQLGLLHFRQQIQQQRAIRLIKKTDLAEKFLTQLPFPLTGAQQRVWQELQQDLQQEKPMLRLLQGDVGSGKTVVAMLAALIAMDNGYQVAVMAPTELLAEQHFNNFQKAFAPLAISVACLSGKLTGKKRQTVLAAIANGEVTCVIGTHALFQEEVAFHNLALIVVDEQHRFGVHQRLALREKGAKNGVFPHQFIMTATPIPRTLAMLAYADLDYSVLDELPPGRTPIKTIVLSGQRRDEILQRVVAHCQLGQQVYWVCTLIEESEVLQCEAAEKTFQQLTLALPHLRIGLIHGRQKSPEKEQQMLAFKNKDIDLLVATTVIEVGVDVPNATLMIIENAERLGLAQLHQLRGRVGRGALQSYCVLMYQSPLSHIAKQRLMILKESQDGFLIAQKDLELRGPGEVLGTRQTGLLPFKIADLTRDQHLLPRVQEAAKYLLENYAEQVILLKNRWLTQIAQQYGSV